MSRGEQALLTVHSVRVIHFGPDAVLQCAADVRERGAKSVFLVTTKPTEASCQPLIEALRANGCTVTLWHGMAGEPSIAEFLDALESARRQAVEAVIGFGGGSAMDVAKLVAALADGRQGIGEVVGVDQLIGRSLWLGCIPTTAGTGSEVTPIAILSDEAESLKKAVVSRHLLPDGAYLDPQLTVSMPPEVTAATGVDALTHCIEAYANQYAHPLVDVQALEGIALIGRYLERAFHNGQDLQARAALLRASFFGGLCLGPVNTAAVHALAYPLGGEFHVTHGVANALLLPHVLRFNLEASPERYARIAWALGVAATGYDRSDAQQGIERIRGLISRCGVPAGMRHFGVKREDLPRMASAALTVRRLLERNLRPLTQEDALAIYEAAW